MMDLADEFERLIDTIVRITMYKKEPELSYSMRIELAPDDMELPSYFEIGDNGDIIRFDFKIVVGKSMKYLPSSKLVTAYWRKV